MMKKTIGILLWVGLVWSMAGMAVAEEAGGFVVYPTAIFPSMGAAGVRDTATRPVTSCCSLVANPDLLLVEREEINKTMSGRR